MKDRLLLTQSKTGKPINRFTDPMDMKTGDRWHFMTTRTFHDYAVVKVKIAQGYGDVGANFVLVTKATISYGHPKDFHQHRCIPKNQRCLS